MTRNQMIDEAVRCFCERRWWGRNGKRGNAGRTPADLIYRTKNGKETVNGPVCKSIRAEFRRIAEEQRHN